MVDTKENRFLLSYLTRLRLSIFMLAGLGLAAPCFAADPPRMETPVSVQITCPQADSLHEQLYRKSCERVISQYTGKGLVLLRAPGAQPPAHLILVRPTAEQISNALEKYAGSKITLIDGPPAKHPATMRVIHFRDQEGGFLMGIIAALTSDTGTIGFIGDSHVRSVRDMAHGFEQGVKYVGSKLRLMTDFADAQSTPRMQFTKQLNAEADEIFYTSDEDLPSILASAQQVHRRVMLLQASTEHSDHVAVATSMVRRPEFALRDALLAIEQNRWTPGMIELGVREGYLDYMLNQENKSVLSHEVVDRVEEARDLIIRGALIIRPAPQP